MIRRATTDDLPGIMRLERECFGSEQFAEDVVLSMIRRKDAFTFVAEECELVVGAVMCMFSVTEGEGKIASMAVLKSHRGKGIARELLEACEDRFRSLGLSLFTLEVDIGNDPALRLYTSKGYRIRGVIQGFYSRGRDAYVMMKKATG